MKKDINSCDQCPSKDEGIFCNLNFDQIDDMGHHKITNKYKKGQTLFIQGTHPYGLYCISNGNIKLSQTGVEGKESIVRIAYAGDILGHRSLFTDEDFSKTATAMEDSEVCFIDKKYILALIAKEPSVALNIINKLSRDMGKAESKLSSLHQKSVRERLSELLLSLKATHGIKENKRWKIELKITREEMATMIGTANETLIRFMSELKNEGIIEQEGKVIYIINENKLLDSANIHY